MSLPPDDFSYNAKHKNKRARSHKQQNNPNVPPPGMKVAQCPDCGCPLEIILAVPEIKPIVASIKKNTKLTKEWEKMTKK